MKAHRTQSWVDMSRLARIFVWLTAGLLIFMLGMIFMSAINADILSQSTDTSTTSSQ